jgi:hypothetical protein
MTIWRGIHSHSTDVDTTPGVSIYQANTRMQKQGELQRRWGFLSSTIAQQTGPIRYIVGTHGLGNNFLTFNLGGAGAGNLTGFAPAPDQPVGPKARRPDVIAGNPVAPVINFITDDPAGPTLYPAGLVTFTPNIAYDGLSGPLIYSWQASMIGQFAQVANISGPTNNPTAVYDFDAGSLPDNYEALVGLTVSTTLNGFSDNMQYFYTVL